jgi:phosphoribosylaminoimidazolecarboxamide formyltransferase/IMP cyclohydrolase
MSAMLPPQPLSSAKSPTHHCTGYTQKLGTAQVQEEGQYNIVHIDPNYVPAEQEIKQVFGITFQQGRNNFAIMRSF